MRAIKSIGARSDCARRHRGNARSRHRHIERQPKEAGMLFGACNCIGEPSLVATLAPLCGGGAGFVSAVIGTMIANSQSGEALRARPRRARGRPSRGPHGHRQCGDPIRPVGAARGHHHRAAQRRQHHSGCSAVRGTQRRAGVVHARAIVVAAARCATCWSISAIPPRFCSTTCRS